MSLNQQFNTYASYYDLLYKDKNYSAEANFIKQLLVKHSKKNIKTLKLIDLACGTGRHLIELGKKGFNNLSGSDISKAMIDEAKNNAAKSKYKLQLYNYSFQEAFKISHKYDVVISMFSAFNYLTSYNDQHVALNNINKLLTKKGLFVFDYWNGHAVVNNYSPVKVLRKKNGNNELIRISETTLDLINQKAKVKFNCSYLSNKIKIIQFEETHFLHYYFYSEMCNLLNTHGFDIIHVSPFMSLKKKISADVWNISIVAQKR